MRLRRRGRRRLLMLGGVALLAAGAAFAFTTVRSIQQQRMLSESRRAGLSAYGTGDLDAALKEFAYFFQHKKDDLDLNLTFAEARARLPLADGRHIAEAIDLYTTHGLKLLDAAPNSAEHERRRHEILHRLLKLYGQAGMRYELVQTAERILSSEPDSTEALGAEAESLFLDRQFDQAIPIADRLIELEPDELNWRRLNLEIRTAAGTKSEQMLDQCRRWASEYSGDGRMHVLVATLLLQMDRVDEAAGELARVAELGAGTREVLERAVSLLDLLNEPERASELIAITVRNHPQAAWVREVSIRRDWRAGRFDDALAQIEQAQRDLHQLAPELQRLHALTLISAGSIPQAQQAIQQMLDGSKIDKAHDVDRAWAEALKMALGPSSVDWRTAVDSLRHALVLDPRDPVLHFLLGDAYTRAGESPQALLAYQRSYGLDPDWMAAGIAYANALLTAGRLDEAYRTSRVVISRSAKDRVTPFIVYAKAYVALREVGGGNELTNEPGDLDGEVVNMLTRANTELPNNPEIATLLVKAYILSGATEQARQFAMEVVQNAKSELNVLLALADLSQRNGLGVEQAALDRARSIGGLSIQLALIQASVMAARGDVDGGIALIDQALASSGTHDDGEARQGQCARAAFLLDHAHADAAASLHSLVDHYPESPDVQQFVLAQPSAWRDSTLVAQAMANLERLLGPRSLQVRLAQVNLALRNAAPEQPALAKAMVQLNGILEESSDSLAALSLMAEACSRGDRPNIDRAVECLERAVDLYPGESVLMVRLISLLQQKGEYERAGQYLRELARFSNVDPRITRAELRLLSGQTDFESALARASAIVNDSSSPPDQVVLAAIEFRAGHADQAQRIYERLLSQNPDALVLSQAADFYASTGRFDRGLELIGQIDPPHGGPAAKLALTGAFCQRYGRADQAGDRLARAVQTDPSCIQARNELARHFLTLNDPSRACEQTLEGLKVEPNNAALRATLAVAAMRAGPSDRQSAIKLLRELVAHEQDELLAMLQLLEQIPTRDGKFIPTDAHIAIAKRLVEEHPRFVPAWLLAITLNVDAGRRADAISLARSAVGRLSGQPEPSQWATQLLVEAGRWSEALAEAQEWRRRSLGRPVAIDVAIASILLELYRADDAAQQLAAQAQQIIAERDAFPERYAVWLRILALSGKYDQAVKLIEPLLSVDARWRRLWETTAARLGDTQAYDALTLVELETSDPTEVLSLALQWADLGKRSGRAVCFDRAEMLAIRAGESGAPASQSLIVRGAVAEAREKWEAAESYYRRALAGDPDNPVALNNLAFAIAQSESRTKEALPYIQKALEIEPDQPDLLDTYGQVLSSLSRLDEADRALSKAQIAKPDDIGIAISMVELRLRQNRVKEAHAGLAQLEKRMNFNVRIDPQQRRRLESLQQQLLQTTQTAAGT